MDFHINLDFLPIKALYFLFMAAFACMIPYLPVYFVDLGLEVWQIGIMRGMEPVFVFLLSPVWGAVADKFSKHRSALVLALAGCGVFYFSLVFVPLIGGQFTATSLNNFTKVDVDANFMAECTSFKKSFSVPVSGEVEDTCYLLCESASDSSSPLSGTGYFCSRVKYGWDCLRCAKDKIVVNRGLAESTNQVVAMVVCNSHVQGEVTYSPLRNGPQERLKNNCQETLSCNCDITKDIKTPTSRRLTFALCFLLVSLSVIFNCNVLAFLDAVLMQKLGPENRKDYGKHRMWGAVGWGAMAFLSGYANDIFTSLTNSPTTRYEPVFVIFLICVIVSIVVAVVMEYPEHEKPQKMHKDLYLLFKKPSVILFLFVLAVQGISFGMCLSYVLIFLTSVLKASHTVMGLALLISTLTEVPLLFASGRVMKVIHYEGVVYATLAAYALRYVGYAFIENPLWVFPFQALHGITFGLGWPAFTHFAITNAPKGMATTLQAIMLGMYIGVGVAIGNFFGGFVVEAVGFRKLFLVNVGLLIFTAVVFFFVNQFIVKRQSGDADRNKTAPHTEQEVAQGGEEGEAKTTLNSLGQENNEKTEGPRMVLNVMTETSSQNSY